MAEAAYTGRFAPSPTGPLHYGSLVAAVASYLDARANNGRWLLRIEDLDPPRESPSAPAEIMSQLETFGLLWDEDVLYQSSRLDAYQHYLDQLTASGNTFACTCSRKSTPRVYPGTCRGQSPDSLSEAYAIRLQVPAAEVQINDGVAGLQKWILEKEIGDFIIKRKDGLFAYQLAVVADDIYQDVNHIVRGRDILDSTPRQLALYSLLGESPPDYLHIPVAVDQAGHKLSKQAHAQPVSGNNAVDTLRDVLAGLGQLQPPATGRVEELLQSATQNWNPTRIPRHRDFEAPTRFLTN